jgi:hypothetical protein
LFFFFFFLLCFLFLLFVFSYSDIVGEDKLVISVFEKDIKNICSSVFNAMKAKGLNAVKTSESDLVDRMNNQIWSVWYEAMNVGSTDNKRSNYANYDKLNISLPFTAIIVGSINSGKSTTAAKLIRGMDCFDEIYFYCSSLDEDPVYKSIIKERLVQKKHVYSSKNIDEVLPVEYFAGSTTNKLFVIDDMMNEGGPGMDNIKEIYANGRHKNISIVFLSQGFVEINRTIRKNATFTFITSILNYDEVKRISKYYRTTGGPKQILDCYDRVQATHHTFLLINPYNKDATLQVRVGFERTVIHESNQMNLSNSNHKMRELKQKNKVSICLRGDEYYH